MQDPTNVGEEAVSASDSASPAGPLALPDSNNEPAGMENGDQHTSNGVNHSGTTKSMQPHVPITPPKAGKESASCLADIQPCFPFGYANEDEQMLVVTPDDDFSLYEDAVDTTPSEKVKVPDTPKTNKSPAHNRKNRQKQQHHHHQHRGHHDIPIIDRKVVFETLPKIDIGDDSPATFKRPGAYIYYIDKTPEDEMNQVEYDMDSEDEVFLAKCNKTRRSEGLRHINYDFFEHIMDRLEKETFKHQTKLGDFTVASTAEIKDDDPDDACCVCFDGTSDDTNQIVYCDGCNMAVHQECYGVPLIPELQWFCQRCESEDKKKIACVLCGCKDGALKRTLDNDWVHIICMQWIPEISPIAELGETGKDRVGPRGFKYKVPKARYKLTCAICKRKGGACIQCREKVCTTAFHVPCIRKHNFKRGIRQPSDDEDYDPYTFIDWAYCEKHAKQRKKRAQKYKEGVKGSGADSSSSESEDEEKVEEEDVVERKPQPPPKEKEKEKVRKVGRPRKKKYAERKKKEKPKAEDSDGGAAEGDQVGNVEGEEPENNTEQAVDSDEEKPKKKRTKVVASNAEAEDGEKSKDATAVDSDDEDLTKLRRRPKQSSIAESEVGPMISESNSEHTLRSEFERTATKTTPKTLKSGPSMSITKDEEDALPKRESAEEKSASEEEVGKEEGAIAGEAVHEEQQDNDDGQHERISPQQQESNNTNSTANNLNSEANHTTSSHTETNSNSNYNTNNSNGTKTVIKKGKQKKDNLEPYLKSAEKGETYDADETAKIEEEELIARDLPSWYTLLSERGLREIVNKYNLIPAKLAIKIIKAPAQGIASIFPYWAQKRHSRSGVPLLKRFQRSILAIRKEGRQVESQKGAKECLEDMRTIRHDLERVRIMLELVKKRERAKRAIVEAMSSWFEQSCDPINHSLNYVLDCLHREDKKDIFRAPVTNEIAPGYAEVVTRPMDLTTMRQKLQEGTYKDPLAFWGDATLMYENAKLYNGPKNAVYSYTEHMIKFTTQVRTNFEAGTLFSMPSMPSEDTDHQAPHTYYPHKRKKRTGLKLRKTKRPKQPMLAGEFGLQGAEDEEGLEAIDGEEGDEEFDLNELPSDGEREVKRIRLDGDEIEKKKKKKLIPPEPSRRSVRNTGGEQVEEAVIPDETKKRKKHEYREPIVIEEEPIEMSPEEARQVAGALASKSEFKMGKQELYIILDILEGADTQYLFVFPAERDIPEYTSVIAHPMCYETMRKKIKLNKYTKWDAFWHDVRLVYINSMTFNPKKSIYFTEAQRLLAFSRRLENTELVKKAKRHANTLVFKDYATEYKLNAKVERQKKAREAKALKRAEAEKRKRDVMEAPENIRFSRSGHTSSTLTPMRRKHKNKRSSKREQRDEEESEEESEQSEESDWEEVEERKALKRKLPVPVAVVPAKRPRGRPRKHPLPPPVQKSEESESDGDGDVVMNRPINTEKKSLTVSIPPRSSALASSAELRKRVEFSPGPQVTLEFDNTESVEAVAKAAKELKEKLKKDAEQKAEAERKREQKRLKLDEKRALREPSSKRPRKTGIDTNTYTPSHSTTNSPAVLPTERGSKARDSILTSPPKTPASTSTTSPTSPTSPISPNSFTVWSLRRKQRSSASSPPSNSTSNNNNDDDNNNNNYTPPSNTDTKKLKQGKINSYFSALPKTSLSPTNANNTTNSTSTNTS